MKIEKDLPEDYEAEYEDGVLTVSDGSQEVEKKLDHARVDVEVQGDKVAFSTESSKRNIESIVKTFSRHFDNMVEGLEEEHVYELKGVYAHFPMTIKTEGDQLVVENFMGERKPRKADIMEGVDVSVNGEEITVKGPDKDKVSQTAARIEQLSNKGNRDPRTFQDGIYIVRGDR
ncbi:50S ribosomal protein L6 [Candidatus Nanosalina sp. VS9-1]|uniref:50S ribosomal protein L6 n=1 Tax=Candidatus Nanosalina sp. VS9-1 TaxID=3388566 RepID=UPI0039DF3D2C